MAWLVKASYHERRMSESPELPPKPEVAMALLQTAISVHVYLDPRPSDVRVPASFKKQPQLVLQVGLNMAVPIPDLDVGAEALSCTLSFNRRPEYCSIPWSAIYGLVGDDGRGMIWPDSVPPEVAASAEGRATTTGKPKAKRRLHAVADASPDDAAAVPPKEEGAVAAETEPVGSPEPSEGLRRREPKAGRKAGATKGRSRRAVVSPATPPGSAEQGAGSRADTPGDAQPSASAGTPRRQLPPYLRIVK